MASEERRRLNPRGRLSSDGRRLCCFGLPMVISPLDKLSKTNPPTHGARSTFEFTD